MTAWLRMAALALLAAVCSGCAALVPANPPPPADARPVFREDFSGGLEQWVSEGVGPWGVAGGRLQMDARAPDYDGYRARNVWCRRRLPADYRIELSVWPVAPAPERKQPCNVLFIFGAQMADPARDVLAESPNRTAHYIFLTRMMEWRSYLGREIADREVPEMRNYTITWYPVSAKGVEDLVLRRNAGYHALASASPSLLDVRTGMSRIAIEKRGAVITFLENGRKWFEIVDDGRFGAPLAGGYFGVRASQMKLELDDVRIYELVKE